MNDEFKKLDQLMGRNIPEISEKAGKKKLVLAPARPWLGVALACGLSCIVTIGVIQNHRSNMESVVELTETLDWDVTADESPEEFENTLAYLE